MGSPSRTYPQFRRASLFAAVLLLLFAPPLFMPRLSAQTQPVQATTVPLILPGGLAYDAAGNLYFAETANHVVRRVTPTDALTTVAGTGVQGFAGDGGAATAALLDSPLAVAVDTAGDIYIADSHNARIRRVDAVSGLITTIAAQLGLPSALALNSAGDVFFADERAHLVRRIGHVSGAVSTVAGDGVQGYSGDLGLATLAAIDSPSGIALDAAGDLYIADTHNQRIRRVDAVTGIITSVAGTGQPGFAGDSGAASAATLSFPRGLAMDGAGNLFLVDSSNERIRRIDATTGQISTVAGDGTQAFAGDSSPAVSASLNNPRAVAVSPANLPTLADSGNERIRQVDSAAIIHTIAGLGTTSAGALNLTAPAVALYGTGTMTATLVTSAATGTVTFFDSTSGTQQSLGSAALAGNTASMSTASLAAGPHRLFATYSGDTLHAAAQSSVLSMATSPAPVVAAPVPETMLYGQQPPVLGGTLAGVLPQDAGNVTAAWSSQATAISAPGSYTITATLTGSAAANYTLTQSAAAVKVLPAPSITTLSGALTVHVAPSTSGVPLGAVSLYDAGVLVMTAALSPTGDAVFSSASLSNGTHTLTATYTGNADFLPSTSSAVVATIGTAPAADFTLATTGQTAVTIQSGASAAFSFAANPINGALTSPILFMASGLPAGATATFNPAYLPPAATPATFILTIQTAKTASLRRTDLLVLAVLLPVGFALRGRRSPVILATSLLIVTLGCGDRVNTESTTAGSATYNITVEGTATSANGATLQHTATVTLTVQ